MVDLSIWLVSAIVLGAAVLVAHAALLVAVLRAERATMLERVLALLPPALPIVGWKIGLRAGPIVWTVLVAGYLILRAAR